MQKRIFHIVLVACAALLQNAVFAQDTVRYTGSTLSNVDYHHGQLNMAIGVHNIQAFRANREYPELAGGHNWTYNHAPMLAYWNKTFYLEFLSNPVGEHIPPGKTLMMTSKDGYHWSAPETIFPEYKVPDGFRKKDYPGVAKDLYAVMHQRIGFYTTKNKRLLALAYYGVALDAKDDPNDGNGIGRVVREVYTNGKYGPIYFIRNNASWDKFKSAFPFYTSSKDKGFVAACNELLGQPLMMQQWVEEADRNDPLIPLKRPIKAFSFYHLTDGRVVGLWKNALTSVSKDNGKTWVFNPLRAPGFVNSNAKIWGQKMPDGRYATVYNPSEFRWPLAVSTSDDGLNFKDLLLVNGEITTMRYGGNFKSYGPQYVRGIQEGDGDPGDGNMWVTYSMNKEDIWLASIPTPVIAEVREPINEVFAEMKAGTELRYWNLFSPLWASAQIENHAGKKALVLRDRDRFDYAKAERVIPAGKHLAVEFTIIPAQSDKGQLHIEFTDAKGQAAVRLVFDADSLLKTKAGYRYSGISKYEKDKQYTIKLELNTASRSYDVTVNGEKKGTKIFFAPVAEIARVTFRTGGVRRFPDADTATDQNFDQKDAGAADPEAVYRIESFKTQSF
ncbi:exo-alpha-sialidase [Pedobacter sp. MC2016-15]|uniref:exo-alpha-sialidase n=1 Tax=Pedobacter sp. MC2016-15 TaxID=2994473 RepID=UPI0022453936|nr:exo-alpha-sialidase [Pedobacter sp. MC2016-15]MCX2480442.1 exo-alpha-sialidase [Pedobacter sp. MC2016-15]